MNDVVQQNRDFLARLRGQPAAAPLVTPAPEPPRQAPAAVNPEGIVIGVVKGHPALAVGLDPGRLMAGRLLIQGNSGAGKSMLLRRLFEQAFGRVQLLLLDPDGEFASLAEAFDVAVIDAADVARVGGEAFALQLREHRYSAVLDLSDADAETRLAVAADVCTGLIAAPQAHWHALLVMIDEVQTFAPHYDTGEVDGGVRKRSIAALADMMGRGRKRGVAAVIATQRLAETSKAVAAKATNVIVGRTFLDLDLERAGRLLGFTSGQSEPLRTLADGEFIGVGPALGGRRVRFIGGAVRSRHAGNVPSVESPPTIAAADVRARLREMSDALPAACTTSPAPTHGTPGTRARGRFTPAEDAIITDGYRRKLPVRDIADALAAAGHRRRAVSGISMRAHDLGYASDKAAVQWSDAEDQIIVDAYAREVRIADIVTLLAEAGHSRGRVSVQMRAIALGITRDRVNYWTEPETKIALDGLHAGKPHRAILEDLRQAGFHRGVTALFKFAQKHNICRGAELWTVEEIGHLTRMYADKKPVKEIAAALGKTIGGIRSKASLLNLKQRIAWTDAEYEVLRQAAANGTTLTDAAARIGRPYPNVAATANRIGLSFRRHSPPPQASSEA